MITKLSLNKIASFKNTAVLETEKKINLIYGLNGTGKSTFSNYLQKQTEETYKDCSVQGLDSSHDIIVYNQTFIQDTFFESENLKGIFTLSKENKEGSRAAEGKSLEFTDNIARLASKDFKVVVSGFAKGVDKQALDSAIKYKGQSIIVLPQGITTFNSGFKTYYKQIIDGDVLVLSTFHPKAVWSAGLAMARNPIIYGLADEIFVAESSEKGGTWSGVIDGLKKGRKIFVRTPDLNEKNANSLLIQKGAIAVDYNGIQNTNHTYSEEPNIISLVEDPSIPLENPNEKILQVLNGKPLSVKEIIEKTGLGWTIKKMTTFLQKMEKIQKVKKGRSNQYLLKTNLVEQTNLFT